MIPCNGITEYHVTKEKKEREIKMKTTQAVSGSIREALNNLPDGLIGKRVWICYCNIIMPGNIQSYEVDGEGIKVMVGTDGIGCIERRPEDIFDTAYEALEAKTQI